MNANVNFTGRRVAATILWQAECSTHKPAFRLHPLPLGSCHALCLLEVKRQQGLAQISAVAAIHSGVLLLSKDAQARHLPSQLFIAQYSASLVI